MSAKGESMESMKGEEIMVSESKVKAFMSNREGRAHSVEFGYWPEGHRGGQADRAAAALSEARAILAVAAGATVEVPLTGWPGTFGEHAFSSLASSLSAWLGEGK